MAISRLMKDRIKLLKENGEVVGELQGSVSPKMIVILTNDVVISPGDLLQRVSSNGAEETYEVIDPSFQERFGSIPAQYTIKYKKLGVPEAASAIQNITYNFSGHNARVNNNSVDNSTNIVNENSEVAEHLTLLRQEIQRLVDSSQDQKEALEIVNAIEGQFESQTPSKAVMKTLISALPHAGSIASISSFLLAAVGG